jgi:hypothetical protein
VRGREPHDAAPDDDHVHAGGSGPRDRISLLATPRAVFVGGPHRVSLVWLR